ncbi:hypothetical protein [Desulfonatronum parangueonense]
MRSYLIDELNSTDMQRLLPFLESQGLKASVDGMYWLQIPDDLLSPEQAQHAEECGPFVCSLETGQDWFKVELLVRGRGKLRCSCIAYATPNQREWILDQVDETLSRLEIPV